MSRLESISIDDKAGLSSPVPQLSMSGEYVLAWEYSPKVVEVDPNERSAWVASSEGKSAGQQDMGAGVGKEQPV